MLPKVLSTIKYVNNQISIRNFRIFPGTPKEDDCDEDNSIEHEKGEEEEQEAYDEKVKQKLDQRVYDCEKSSECFDPVQKLFLEKFNEYREKSENETKVVDSTPEFEEQMKNEMYKIRSRYGVKDEDEITKFPEFTWLDPVVDPINERPAKESEVKAKNEIKDNKKPTK